MHIHFIAIGGSAMHNLAIALHSKGHDITGSDDEIFEPSKSRLSNLGLLPEKLGWFPEKISKNIDAIVLGMHARLDNPELIKAQEIGLKIYSYPEFLYEQTKNKKRVVISGSHGKTTTTAMVMHVLKSLGHTFDYMVGAQIEGFTNMVDFNDESEYAIFEGDEYLTSPIDLRPKFHLYKPHIALLTGVAWDHVNVFPTFENYCEQFRLFVDMIEPDGVFIHYTNDPVLIKIAKNTRNDIHVVNYDTHKYKIENDKTYLITDHGTLPLKIFGEHNLQNLHGAYWVCMAMGIAEYEFYNAIKNFSGAAKRLQLLAENENTRIYHDFAHSPSKLTATVNAVKSQFPKKNVIAFMELHTFSSLTSEFLKEYDGSLNNADQAFVYYSKHAIEQKRLKDIDPELVKVSFAKEGMQVINNRDELQKTIRALNLDNAVLLLLSSGNFSGINLKELAEELIVK